MPDSGLPKAQLLQLRSPYHPVLAISQTGKRLLQFASPRKLTHIARFGGLVGHAPIVPGKSARVARTVGHLSHAHAPKP